MTNGKNNQSKNDRSNSLNPNNQSNKEGRDNRSNQLNPNNEKFQGKSKRC